MGRYFYSLLSPTLCIPPHILKYLNIPIRLSSDHCIEPSLEVAEYLKEARVNKIIVGHQPRGDAPLVIDLGTGIQVREMWIRQDKIRSKKGKKSKGRKSKGNKRKERKRKERKGKGKGKGKERKGKEKERKDKIR